ncbi:hypothetical protein CsatB_009305 [Cannabis sativa]
MTTMKSSSSSWEEKAFAEETAGGCIWPPRSYSCSFCMREFRSAQALGGHMNIHRRDRARLKQCLNNISPPNNPHDHDILLDQHQYLSSKPSMILTLDKPFLLPCFDRKEEEDVETDLCVGHGSRNNKPIINSTPQIFRDEEDDDDDHSNNNIDTTISKVAADHDLVSPLEVFFKPSSYIHDHSLHRRSQVIEVNASYNSNNNMDDLDLELRLGHPRKIVK